MSGLHITLYTAQTCQYCQEVRRYLADRSLEYDDISTDDNPEALNTVRQLTGQSLVPVTVVSADGQSDIVIVGFDAQRLDMSLKDFINPQT